MPGVGEILEHAEHAAHAGGHGKPGDHLGTYVGITMAMLGVMLAVAAAKVGGERTELVEAMVDQQNAHAKYQAQDIKHRMAFLILEQVHSAIPQNGAGSIDAELAKIEAMTSGDAAKQGFAAITQQSTRALSNGLTTLLTPSKKDTLVLVDTVERYLKESKAAKEWVEAYDPMIVAHTEAQEHYEMGQILAEMGIVVASVALLLHRKVAWFIALALGVGAISVLGMTYFHTNHEVHESEHRVEELGKVYRDLRNADKTTEQEDKMLADVRAWAGVTAPAKAAEPPKEHGEAHGH